MTPYKMNVICNIQAMKEKLNIPVGSIEFGILSRMTDTKLEEIRDAWIIEYNKFIKEK